MEQTHENIEVVIKYQEHVNRERVPAVVDRAVWKVMEGRVGHGGMASSRKYSRVGEEIILEMKSIGSHLSYETKCETWYRNG